MHSFKTIKSFTSAVRNAVAAELPDCSVETVSVTKNNNVRLHGIGIRPQGSAVSPTVYTEHYFALFQSGQTFEAAVADIIKDCRAALESAEMGIDPNFISSFPAVKDKICYKLVNSELNKKLLDSVPHRNFHGLAVTYYLQLGTADGGTSTVDITNSLAQIWQANESQLYELAQTNTPCLHRGHIVPLADILDGIMGIHASHEHKARAYEYFDFTKAGKGDLPMYDVSNADKSMGAAVILYPGLLKALSKEIGSFYVILSSIHETMIVPDTFCSAADLADLVKSINDTDVPAVEVLSGKSGGCLRYDAKDHTLAETS